MIKEYKLKSGQINFESLTNKGAYACIVIRDGVFHNMTDEQRLELIHILQNNNPHIKQKEEVDLDDMF
jgi:hypothetical protein